MKKFIAIILFALPLFLNARENNTELWEQANNHYTAEEYQKAIGAYEQILANGQESAKLYFNLGNAYYKAGDVNKAILNYERAKKLAPQDEDIAFNLQIANQFVVTKIEELPKPFFLRWKTSIINKYPTDTWAAISVGSFILFLLLLGLFLFSKNSSAKRFAFWFGILAVVFSGFAFSWAAHQKAVINKHNQAIVFCPRVTVKSSPSATGTDLFLIYEGVKIDVTDSLDHWREIKLADGNKGWLPDSCIVTI
ncbi:MAG: tetratricopeptide repeat protein [Draconibacterium sp.]